MKKDKRNGSAVYKDVQYNYSAYGDDNKFGGNAVIYIFTDESVAAPMISLHPDFFFDIDSAEKAIIDAAKKYIDNLKACP